MSVAGVKSLPVPVRTTMAESTARGSVVDMRGVGRVLARRWATIAVSAALLGLLAVLVASQLAPRYQATTKLIFDPRNLQVFQNDLQAASTNGDDIGADAESQLQVVTSARVLARVVDQLDLAEDRDFGAPARSLTGRLSDTIAGLLHRTGPAAADPRSVALRRLQQAVSVRRPEKTYILEVTVETGDPDMAARIANAIAASFLEEVGTSRADATRRSGDELANRLDELRNRLTRSEQAVEKYRTAHDLVNAGGRLLVDQQITDLTNQITLARTRVAEQQARLDDVRRTASQKDGLDAVSEAGQSPSILAARTQLAAARRAVDEARLTFGPRHPAMAQASVQVQAAQARLDAETARLARTASSDLDRARSSEAGLEARLDALKRANNGASESSVELRDLERVATSDRLVYETFLNRAKDLQERQSLTTVDARVLTPAVAPMAGSGPSRMLLVLGGVVAGGLAGVALALGREQFDRTLRSPRQAVAETQLPVLATLRRSGDLDDPALWALRDRLTAEAGGRVTRLVVIASLRTPPRRVELVRDLAGALELDGCPALLVDADDEARDLTRLMRAEADPGLSEMLATPVRASLRDTLRTVGAVRFIPAGLASNGIAGRRREIRTVADVLLRDARVVIIYAGAAGSSARLRTLVSAADDVVVMVEAGAATVDDVASVRQTLGGHDDLLRGLVLTGPAGLD